MNKERIEELKKLAYIQAKKKDNKRGFTNKVNNLIDSVEELSFEVYKNKVLELFTDLEVEFKERLEVTCFLTAFVNARLETTQAKATKKWTENNREHSNYLKNRSTAKSFVMNKATTEDLKTLKELIDNKLEE